MSSITYKLLINDSSGGEVEPERGLRQGNPLSSYLFILCTDILSKLPTANSDVQGIKVSRNAPAISHLLYADDLLLAGRVNVKSARAIWKCLTTFCSWSGQHVNREKSSILFSEGTSREDRRKIFAMWGLRGMKKGSVYLGNGLVMGKNRQKELCNLKN